MANARGHRAHSPGEDAPSFSLEDFVQDAQESALDDVDDFSWVQEAEERESEDIAAWGAAEDTGEPFVWYQEPQVTEQASDSPAPDTRPQTTPANASKPSHFRPEIEGLRAVSVLMIVIYHVWLGRVSGGVDVFLFISAFLLGSSFARRLDARKPFGPVRYWLRTFTRLMPPATIAILGTLLGSFLILPESSWQTVISHAIASATYVQNIWLSITSVDYYALDASTASPLQHFWSLSLQGQVFLTWPLLFIAAKFAARKSAHPRRVAFGFFSVVAAASFVFSIYYTATHQSAAYFSTPARAWEVACGTLLALALPTLDRLLGSARPGSPEAPRHRTLRALAGWAGFALLVSLGIVLNVQGLFPGWIALWPLTGAGLIIVAGYSGTSWGFDRVLTMKLPRALASSSYSLYLVHWPILILWLAHSGQKRAGALDGLIVILGSMALAWVLSTIVDSRFRKPAWKTAPWWRSLTVIGTCLALVLGGALGLRGYLASQQTSAPITAGATENSNALTATFNPDTLSPKGFELDGQWPNLPHLCDDPSGVLVATKDIPCETLRPLGSKASATVLVVGSSHSRQFIPTILDEAKAKNWQIINFTKNACPFREDSMLGDGEYCKGYFDQVMKAIDTHHPDLVLMTSTAATPTGTEETVPPGTREGIQAVLDKGVNVLAVRDAPRWPTSLYTCAEAVIDAGGTPELADQACGADLSTKLASTDPSEVLDNMSGAGGARVFRMDISDLICPDGHCAPIQGNAYVYMDDNHLTRVFTSGIAKEVSARFEQLGIRLGSNTGGSGADGSRP